MTIDIVILFAAGSFLNLYAAKDEFRRGGWIIAGSAFIALAFYLLGKAQTQ